MVRKIVGSVGNLLGQCLILDNKVVKRNQIYYLALQPLLSAWKTGSMPSRMRDRCECLSQVMRCNFAVREEIKKKFTQLIQEWHDSQPNDNNTGGRLRNEYFENSHA